MLESFYYINDWQIEGLKECKMFLLDSGAFTFMQNSKKAVDWDEYLSRYIVFINKYDIKYFFELDIDSVIGYAKVKQMRQKLEHETGKKCIPVWHKSRGLEEYKKLCREYDYIAIGGIVSKEIKPSEYEYLKKLVQFATQHGTKVHGLGFTNKDAAKYGFYSVDSTSFTSGSRFGQVAIFNGKYIINIARPENKRIRDYKEVLAHNYDEWLKCQKYLDSKGARK